MGIVHGDAAVALDPRDATLLPAATVGAAETDFLTWTQAETSQDLGLLG
jgi:hypothetical protein